MPVISVPEIVPTTVAGPSGSKSEMAPPLTVPASSAPTETVARAAVPDTRTLTVPESVPENDPQ